MVQYIGVVHKDVGSCYGISFPDLPGCFSSGDSLEHLIHNAIEAVALFLEDRDADNFPPREMTAVERTLEKGSEHTRLIAIPYLDNRRTE